MASQRTFWDMRDAAGNPLFEQTGVVRELQPLSTRQLVDNVGQDADPWAPLGTQASGRQRETVQDEVGTALREFYFAAWAMFDEQRAAELLLSMCARDPQFEPPDWLRELWELYRAELRAAFHGASDDGRTDWGWSWEEGDDDE
ncbi:MAG TPA: hypothetical protein VFZ61_03740 [Polyangiales bacterium]